MQTNPIQHALHLLNTAAARYDSDPTLQRAARQAAPSAFAGGAHWMHTGLSALRGAPQPATPHRAWQVWGVLKYGACALATVAWLATLARLDTLWLAPTLILPFYALEAQMVFLFPLLLDGSRRPLHDARAWTLKAGGTLQVMLTVLPLAATMLFGGFLGRGFVRSWCLGCMAVLVWYEELRTDASPTLALNPQGG